MEDKDLKTTSRNSRACKTVHPSRRSSGRKLAGLDGHIADCIMRKIRKREHQADSGHNAIETWD
jgi:hypothetical protein